MYWWFLVRYLKVIFLVNTKDLRTRSKREIYDNLLGSVKNPVQNKAISLVSIF